MKGRAEYCFLRWVKGKICYPHRPQYPDGFANLFLYGAINRSRFTDGGGQYEATVFNYATDFDAGGGLLGYADDNWLDGTQSAVFAFVDPTIVEFGYGLSTTTIHEVGHHVGMSHPHDGFDYERGIDFGPADRFYYAWSGDESNSIMSYIDVNWDFSQFDLDNHWRTTAAAYLINANAIAADVLASPDAAAGMAALGHADVEAGLAQAAFTSHDYAAAFDHAQAAFGFAKQRRARRRRAGAGRQARLVRPASGEVRGRRRRDPDVRPRRQARWAFAPGPPVGEAHGGAVRGPAAGPASGILSARWNRSESWSLQRSSTSVCGTRTALRPTTGSTSSASRAPRSRS